MKYDLNTLSDSNVLRHIYNGYSKYEVETLRASLIVIFKCWLKTKPRALYIWEKGTTFNPKLRFVVFHSIAFSTKPNIIGLPTKTMFQPENSNTLYNIITMILDLCKTNVCNIIFMILYLQEGNCRKE